MSTAISSPFLRRALVLDAVATGGMALLLVLGAGLLSDPLGLPTALLRYAGVLLVPFVAVVAWAETRTRLFVPVIWTIVAVNALWVVASVALLLGNWVAPTAPGYTFVLAQAAVVGLFAESQVLGLRQRQTVSA